MIPLLRRTGTGMNLNICALMESWWCWRCVFRDWFLWILMWGNQAYIISGACILTIFMTPATGKMKQVPIQGKNSGSGSTTTAANGSVWSWRGKSEGRRRSCRAFWPKSSAGGWWKERYRYFRKIRRRFFGSSACWCRPGTCGRKLSWSMKEFLMCIHTETYGSRWMKISVLPTGPIGFWNVRFRFARSWRPDSIFWK